MVGKSAKHLKELHINVILTESVSWLNVTLALENLRV